MTDVTIVIQEIRKVSQALNECSNFIENKAKKEEYERLIQELRALENSLLVTSSSQLLPLNPNSRYTRDLGLRNFNVYADNNKLTDVQSIRQAAYQQLPQTMYANQAVNNVINNLTFKEDAEIQAISLGIIDDVKMELAGRNLTKDDLSIYVKRFVAGLPKIRQTNASDNKITAIAQIVTDRIWRERQLI